MQPKESPTQGRRNAVALQPGKGRSLQGGARTCGGCSSRETRPVQQISFGTTCPRSTIDLQKRKSQSSCAWDSRWGDFVKSTQHRKLLTEQFSAEEEYLTSPGLSENTTVKSGVNVWSWGRKSLQLVSLCP